MPASKRPDSTEFRAELRRLISESVSETLAEHRIVDVAGHESRSRVPAPANSVAATPGGNVVQFRVPGST